jgi:TnpA family transposase
VYWHVDRGSVVVHSQTLRASEVHAMVEGASRPGTTMNVEGNYVDSRGQSEIGFGITRLLNIDLLPRIKRINKVRLYRPAAGDPGAYPRLTPALTRPITGERHLFKACTILCATSLYDDPGARTVWRSPGGMGGRRVNGPVR